MRLLKILILIAISLCDVSVHAKEIITLGNAQKIVEEPLNCLEGDDICAIKTSANEKYKLILGEVNIVLDENTALVRNSEKVVTLLSGQIWVNGKSQITVKSEYGEIISEKGNFWVIHQEKKVIIEAIDTNLVLKPRLSPSDLKLEAGEQNWFGPIDQNQISSSGIPMPIDPNQLLFRWAKLYPGTKSKFEKEFKAFVELWRPAVENLAEHHAVLAKRRVASIEEENERQLKIKKAREKEDRRIRNWFRERELSN